MRAFKQHDNYRYRVPPLSSCSDLTATRTEQLTTTGVGMSDQPTTDRTEADVAQLGRKNKIDIIGLPAPAKSKTFNTLDLRIDQAIDKTCMAKEELVELRGRLVDQPDALPVDDANDLTTHLEAAATALRAARAIVWKAADNA